MSFKTITVSDAAYKRLKSHKHGPKISFSDIILRKLLPPPANTAGELLDALQEFEGDPELDQAWRDYVAAERAKQAKQSRKKAA